MAIDYSPILVVILFGTGFACILALVATLLGPKHLSAEKLAPFDCGSEPIGSPRVRFSVKFYQVAILFVVFDIETAFMYPWAVLYRKLSCAGQMSTEAASGAMAVCSGGVSFFGFAEMVTFLLILVAALAYVWRKKAIGWG